MYIASLWQYTVSPYLYPGTTFRISMRLPIPWCFRHKFFIIFFFSSFVFTALMVRFLFFRWSTIFIKILVQNFDIYLFIKNLLMSDGLKQNLVIDVCVAVANIFSLRSFLVFSSLIRVHILLHCWCNCCHWCQGWCCCLSKNRVTS